VLSDREPHRLPIKLDATANGEFVPVPVDAGIRAAKRLARERIGDNARRLGLRRRDFLAGLCGAATMLTTLDAALAARGNVGGRFLLPPEASFEPAAAAEVLQGSEFIFDVQTHLVNPVGGWRQRAKRRLWEGALAAFPQGRCGEADPVACFSADRFIKEVFIDSDTHMAVLSFVPALPEDNPLSIEEAQRTRQLIAALKGSDRLLLHGMVLPNAPETRPLETMAKAAREWNIAAWKVYTQWGPRGQGWRLDDPEIGIPFIEQARALGIRTICVHKGLPFAGMPLHFAHCDDIGPAARRYPDVSFIVYHSGFETDRREGPFDAREAERGIDGLIKSLLDNGIGANANVYAELGSTWRFLMRDPTAAAHALGKLLRHVGEERVLWGTDSIWYGSPQDQLQAFRSFVIDPALSDRWGYPSLTPSLKAKVLGLNGAAAYRVDPVAAMRRAATDPIGLRKLAESGNPDFTTLGPCSEAEHAALLRERGGMPG
jgi:predicted TIM-barrel fold metal-dependent hydrolase